MTSYSNKKSTSYQLVQLQTPNDRSTLILKRVPCSPTSLTSPIPYQQVVSTAPTSRLRPVTHIIVPGVLSRRTNNTDTGQCSKRMVRNDQSALPIDRPISGLCHCLNCYSTSRLLIYKITSDMRYRSPLDIQLFSCGFVHYASTFGVWLLFRPRHRIRFSPTAEARS